MNPRKKRQSLDEQLSRRERQIMGVIYRLGRASVADLVAELPDPPTQDAVRRLCHILEEKGHLRHRPDGPRNQFYPVVSASRAGRSALEGLMDTFFGGSPEMLVAALLKAREKELSDADLQRLSALIDETARGEGEA